MTVPIRIYTAPEWAAVPAKQEPAWCPASVRIIVHATAGHHPEISLPVDESLEEAMRYARDIQHFHMAPPPLGRGWDDSGHNFLVCRNGVILQGRWRTVKAIEQRQMVVSAHCPGQNGQVGIEHEHLGAEAMTDQQRNSSARLIAWISDQYGHGSALPLQPHSAYFNTACPANLRGEIPRLASEANAILKGL